MGLTIERGNFHVEIGKHQRLPLEIVGGDGREESKIQLHFAANVHGENTLRRSILVGRLIDRSGSWQPHPCVGISVYTDNTGPANDLASVRWSVHVCDKTIRGFSLPKPRPFTSQVATITPILSCRQPRAQVG